MKDKPLFPALFFSEVLYKILFLEQRFWMRCFLCEVIGDMNYRHLLLHIYVKTGYCSVNPYYREFNAIRTNNFLIAYNGFSNGSRRLVFGDRFTDTNLPYFLSEERVLIFCFFHFQRNDRECRCLLSF